MKVESIGSRATPCARALCDSVRLSPVTAKATPLGAQWGPGPLPPPVQKPAIRGLTHGNGVDLTHSPNKLLIS